MTFAFVGQDMAAMRLMPFVSIEARGQYRWKNSFKVRTRLVSWFVRRRELTLPFFSGGSVADFWQDPQAPDVGRGPQAGQVGAGPAVAVGGRGAAGGAGRLGGLGGAAGQRGPRARL